MTDPRLYIYALASLCCLFLGGLFVFNRAHWLGKAGPRQAISSSERIVVGGVLVFVGILGSLTSYAVFVVGEPMYFLGLVFEWICGTSCK